MNARLRRLFVKFDLTITTAMKQLFLIILFAALISSCASQSQLIETNDPYKKIENAKLVQYVTAKPDDSEMRLSNGSYELTSVYLYEGSENGQSAVSLALKMEIPVRTDELDSVIFIDIDGEKIRMIANDYKYKQVASSSLINASVEEKPEDNEKLIIQSTVVNNYQIMTQCFMIPENFWVSIANSNNIGYRIYLGKEGLDIVLSKSQIKRLKCFFQLSISKRDAKTPPLPAGYKKW
jgi:hypothetical protein